MKFLLAIVGLLMVGVVFPSPVFAVECSAGGELTRIMGLEGAQPDDFSYSPIISQDGRFILFFSQATNLVADDTTLGPDVFIYDRVTCETNLVSVASDGVQGIGQFFSYDISSDGRFVTFTTEASNLVPGDANNFCNGFNCMDVFVHDRLLGLTSLVSVDSNGIQGNNASSYSVVSANGRFVAFTSHASNLVPNDTNNFCLENGVLRNCSDIFVHDRYTRETTRVSVSSSGVQGNNGSFDPSISADGRFVVFLSAASNLAPGPTAICFGVHNCASVFLHDRQTRQTKRLAPANAAPNGSAFYPSFSADGRFVVFTSAASNLVPDDTNGKQDVFLYNRLTDQISRVSLRSNGAQANGDATIADISANGRYVAFISFASNLVPGDTNGSWDVFVRDQQTGQIRRVSLGAGGEQPNEVILSVSISGDGRVVTFDSAASNLVPDDTNDRFDIFVVGPVPVPVDAPFKNRFTTDLPTLTWGAISWAAHYQVQIDSNIKFTAPEVLTSDLPEITLSSVETGQYYWRVRAQDADGKWGGWSQPDVFVVDLR